MGVNIVVDSFTVNIVVLRGSPNSTVKYTGRTWTVSNSTQYSFPQSSTFHLYNFTLPTTPILAGTNTVRVTITPAGLNSGNVDFGIVNRLANPNYVAYNYSGSLWEQLNGEFAFKVGLRDPFQNASIQARIGTSTWKNITEPGLFASFGMADGGPWKPSPQPGQTMVQPNYLPYFGVNITVRSNESFQSIVSLYITYINESNTVRTVRSFSLAGNRIAWNASYDASIPAWNDTTFNNTLYTLTRDPSTQMFTINIPYHWYDFNATGPASIEFGNASIATIKNESGIWNFTATSTGIDTALSVTPDVARNGQSILVNGSLAMPLAGNYTGNESFWTNQTTLYSSITQKMAGQSFRFTTNFTVPPPSKISSGFYAMVVILDNGTNLAWASKQVQVIFATISMLQGNTTSGNLEGPVNSQITGIVRFATVGNTTGIANATISTSWGPQDAAWYAVPVAGVPGTYDIHLITGNGWCLPGESRLVVVSFSRNDSQSQNVSFVVHPWRATSISHSALPATIRVNETVAIGINYTDDRGTVLTGVGTSNTTASYSLGGYSNSSLKSPLVPGTSSTCILDLNTTNIPLETKAGTYTLDFRSRCSGRSLRTGRIPRTGPTMHPRTSAYRSRSCPSCWGTTSPGSTHRSMPRSRN